MHRSFKSRLAQLEALEAAQNPSLPAFVCIHALDAAALDDPATPARVRDALLAEYRIGGQQKWYVDLCGCVWDPDGGESCRVCCDAPLVRALA